MDVENKSPHILNTSATLFGLCFVVFTSLKAMKLSGTTVIDEITAISMLMFMVSCLTSFLAIRSATGRGQAYERIADYVFLTGLLTLFVTTIFIVFDIIS